MSDIGDLALKTINVVRNFSSTSQSGVTFTSDQITYPKDLSQVPDDTHESGNLAAWIYSSGSGLYAANKVMFALHGNFRSFSQTIIDDPESVTPPIMANVYIDLDTSALAGFTKASDTELEIHFTALETPYGTAVDPRIRFLCEGHFDPAGTGDCRFRAILEIDTNGAVNCVEGPEATGDGQVSDASPNGFTVGINYDGHSVIL